MHMLFSGKLEAHLHRYITRGESIGRGRRWLSNLVMTVLTVCVTSVIAWLLVIGGFPSPETLSVLFVIPVLFSAVFYGFQASVSTTILSVIAYNFVLLPPVWHIGLFEAENIAKLLTLGFMALIASALSARIRKLAREALQREQVISGVYALSQDMLGISNVADMMRAAENKLSSLLSAKVQILLSSEKDRLSAAGLYCLQQDTPCGKGTRHFTDDAFLYLPLSSRTGALGVMTLCDFSSEERFSSKILATLAAQTSNALEKAALSELHQQKIREAEREKFLSALLSSVSHDFKTPLVTVIGALSSLKEMAIIRNDFGCREMVAGGLEEAQKLHRFINNLVEISRLESGLESVIKEPVSLRDVLASALKSLYPLIGKQRFSISTTDYFPLLLVNPVLMELVFLNLLENALKYGPPEGEVKIIARYDGQSASIDIDDDGEGIPPEEREAIFIKFYRARHGDRRVAGTGLGLYICRAIVEAHGGTVAAIDPHDGQGACVRIMLPQAVLLPVEMAEELEEA